MLNSSLEENIGILGKTIKLADGFKIEKDGDHAIIIAETSNTTDNGLGFSIMNTSSIKAFYKSNTGNADATNIKESTRYSTTL